MPSNRDVAAKPILHDRTDDLKADVPLSVGLPNMYCDMTTQSPVTLHVPRA